MKRFKVILFFVSALCLTGCATSENRTCVQPMASAVDSPAVEEQVKILRGEVAAMRNEINALRRDLAAKGIAANPANKMQAPPDMTRYDVAIGSSPVLGPKDAPVTIVEFADFQCLYCVREYPKIKQIVQEYPDKVKLVFKHFPLPMHNNAKPAHAAAELANRQGDAKLFWKMHDMIIASPNKLDVNSIRGYAKSMSLDMVTFDEVMADPNKINDLISDDLAEAKKCSVHGTPTVLINGVKLADRTVNGYKTRINNILAGR